MRKKILPLALIIAALAIISYFIYDYISDRLKEDPSVIEASGIIEITTVTLSSPSSGKLKEVFFEESDTVGSGDIVATMDTQLIEKQIDITRANIAAAQTQLDAAMMGYDQAVELSEKSLELAGEIKGQMLLYNHYIYYDEPLTVTSSESTSSQATSFEYSGSQQLLNAGTTGSNTSGSSDSTSVSYPGPSQKQSVRVQLQDALNQYDLALLRLKQAMENDLAVKMAEDHLNIARVQLELYKQQLKELEIVSPSEGTIINRFAEPGEYLLPGSPVFEIGKLLEVTCDIYIPENKYGMIFPGQEVILSVDSYPGEEFKGSVLKIADEAEFTPKNIQTKDDRVTTVYRITIFIDNPDMKLKAGMPADVVINTSFEVPE